MTQQVAVSELRAHLTDFLQKVIAGEEVFVTSRGRVIAKIVPVETTREAARQSLQQLRETAVLYDVLSPLDDEWDAME